MDAAAHAYAGSMEGLRIAWRAARAATRRPAPAIWQVPREREAARDFRDFSDLLTIGNGWDYLGYESLHDMKAGQGFGTTPSCMI